jgi:hypothetical protein
MKLDKVLAEEYLEAQMKKEGGSKRESEFMREWQKLEKLVPGDRVRSSELDNISKCIIHDTVSEGVDVGNVRYGMTRSDYRPKGMTAEEAEKRSWEDLRVCGKGVYGTRRYSSGSGYSLYQKNATRGLLAIAKDEKASERWIAGSKKMIQPGLRKALEMIRQGTPPMESVDVDDVAVEVKLKEPYRTSIHGDYDTMRLDATSISLYNDSVREQSYVWETLRNSSTLTPDEVFLMSSVYEDFVGALPMLEKELLAFKKNYDLLKGTLEKAAAQVKFAQRL